MQARTTFIISHLLFTVHHATPILVLEGGQIVQSGSHGMLRTQQGLYKRLCELQFQDPGRRDAHQPEAENLEFPKFPYVGKFNLLTVLKLISKKTGVRI